MKKLLLSLTIGLLSIGIMTGCSTQHSASGQAPTKTTLLKATKISTQDAVDIYQKKFPNAEISSIELKKHFGTPTYSIEGFDKKNEYELNVNATNKKVVHQSNEAIDHDDYQELQAERIDLNEVVSLDKAVRIAESKVKSSQSTELKLESEDGLITWEIKAKHKEITINAKTGEIIKVEND